MVSNQTKQPPGKKKLRVVRKKSNHGCIMVVKLDNTMTSTADSRARQQMQSVRKELKDRTHFHDFEVERLLHIYWKITQNARMNTTEFQFFLLHVFGMTNLYMIKLMYNFLKEKKLTGKAHIGPETFVSMLSIFCRGTLEEKINFAFKVYDQGVGVLSDETVMNYLRRTFYNKGMQDGLIEYEPREYFSYVLQIFDPNDEKKITYNRFKEAIMEQPQLLQALGQIFPDRLAIYAFLTTFTHLVTTHHVKYISQKEAETTIVMPVVREKNVVKMQMVPFTQDHMDEIFNEILEEIPVRDEEKESEDEEQEGEEVKETNILDDEDIDEFIYDEEESEEEELLEDDEEESDKVEDEEEIIIEEEEEEEEESEEEPDAVLADEEKGAETEEVQGESKEESMDLDEEESSTLEEEYEDAAETIDLGRDDILLQVSSSFECEDVEEESTEESEESETETVSTEEEESSTEEEESEISSETELKGIEGEEEMRGEEFEEGEIMEGVEGEEAGEPETTEPETVVEEFKKSEEASDKKSDEADKAKETEDEAKEDEEAKSTAGEESEVEEE